jgi:membrane dipeptidase
MVLRHLAHIVDVVGDEHAALGSDWDGFIVPPPELRDVTCLPAVVAEMLSRGWSEERIGRILGGNLRRCLAAVRPG